MTAAPYPSLDGTENCAGTDPDLFFPPAGREGHAVADQAKTICAGCPFLHPCAAYALDRPSLYGIWGGLTDHDRATIRRRRREAA